MNDEQMGGRLPGRPAAQTPLAPQVQTGLADAGSPRPRTAGPTSPIRACAAHLGWTLTYLHGPPHRHRCLRTGNDLQRVRPPVRLPIPRSPGSAQEQAF